MAQQFPVPNEDQINDWINHTIEQRIWYSDETGECDYEKQIAILASSWAADVQLEAVKEYLTRYFQWADEDLEELHNAMRRCPTLKDEVMDIIERAKHGYVLSDEDWNKIVHGFIQQSHI